MAYLRNENNEIIVDAILTDYGRAKLAQDGKLNITKFALSDDEVDYSLYNVNHPDGSAWFDVAIREMPLLEASPNSGLAMKYKLFTTPNESAISYSLILANIPSEISGGSIGVNYLFTPTLSPLFNGAFFRAELTSTNIDLRSIELVAEDSSDGVSNAILLARQGFQLPSNSSIVAIGTSFHIAVKNPIVGGVATLTVFVDGDLARPVSKNITFTNSSLIEAQ